MQMDFNVTENKADNKVSDFISQQIFKKLDAWDKRSDLVLWEDLEGAGGEGGGRGDQDGEDMWTQGLFFSIYDKIHYKKNKEATCSDVLIMLSKRNIHNYLKILILFQYLFVWGQSSLYTANTVPHCNDWMQK